MRRWKGGRVKSEFTPEEEEGVRAGERIVFAAWAGAIAIGLALMIAIPLSELLT
jgi:hypothetical protein